VAKQRAIGTILSFIASCSRLRHAQPSIAIWPGFCRKPSHEAIHLMGAKLVQFDAELVLPAQTVSFSTSGGICSKSY
jgi:hypothetical protein